MGWNLLSESEPVARKDYTCDWCGEQIDKSIKYYKWTGNDNGDLVAGRMHTECRAANIRELKEEPRLAEEPLTRGNPRGKTEAET